MLKIWSDKTPPSPASKTQKIYGTLSYWWAHQMERIRWLFRITIITRSVYKHNLVTKLWLKKKTFLIYVNEIVEQYHTLPWWSHNLEWTMNGWSPPPLWDSEHAQLFFMWKRWKRLCSAGAVEERRWIYRGMTSTNVYYIY